MIKSVTVTNYLGESIEIELAFPEKSGFAITKIEGIASPKSDVNVTEVVTADGGLFNSSRMISRDIKIKMLYYGVDIESIRQKSYKYFPSKRPVRLLFKNENRTIYASGYVEENKTNIFDKKEGSEITIVCPDPYFYALKNTETVFSGVVPLFEFPFDNNSVSENLIEMGNIVTKQYETVYYKGEAEVGVTIVIHSLGTVGTLTIYNIDTRQSMQINKEKLEALTGKGIVKGDTITICTEKFNKSITLLRSGVKTNILNCLERGTDWFTLNKGDNIFAYVTDEGASNVQFKVTNKVVYEGV